MDLISALINEGFDKSTAETVVSTADQMSVSEAKELLEGMLGLENPIVASYTKKREHKTQISQLKLPKRIMVNENNGSFKSNNTNSSAPVFSNEEKIDSVKELEGAIKQLTINSEGRLKCDCMGARHGLLEMAPNCLACGRIVCNKEGLGPCLFCKAPLLPTDRIIQIRNILSNEKDKILSTMSKRALTQLGIDPKAIKHNSSNAEENLERLLNYQQNDAQRTRIIDRVGEVDLPVPGEGKWMTADEQAEHIRMQQRKLRQLEKQRKRNTGARKVISINMQGKKQYTVYKDEDVYVSSSESEEEEEVVENDKQNEFGDDKVKSSVYYDANKYKAPKIAAEVLNEGCKIEINEIKSAVIRTEEEFTMY